MYSCMRDWLHSTMSNALFLKDFGQIVGRRLTAPIMRLAVFPLNPIIVFPYTHSHNQLVIYLFPWPLLINRLPVAIEMPLFWQVVFISVNPSENPKCYESN